MMIYASEDNNNMHVMIHNVFSLSTANSNVIRHEETSSSRYLMKITKYTIIPSYYINFMLSSE